MKNGQIIENSQKYQIEFRNGVCRMTIPQSHPGSKTTPKFFKPKLKKTLKLLTDDAATYECVAQNPLGADSTSAVLMVPGDKRGFRIY